MIILMNYQNDIMKGQVYLLSLGFQVNWFNEYIGLVKNRLTMLNFIN